MKTLNNNKTILLTCILFLSTIYAYAYPPDNASVLYYKAIMAYEVDDEMKEMLYDFRDGKIELNNKIRDFVDKNRLTINTILDASEVKNCDWGMDFSQGLDMQIPQLAALKNLAKLIAVDAKILAQDGHYGPALDRCMSLYKMARHVNDEVFICYLVGMSINTMANDCLIQIMSEMPQNTKNLTELRTDLVEIDSAPLSIKPALLGERKAMLTFMTPEQMPDLMRSLEPSPGSCGGSDTDDNPIDDSIKEKLLSGDETFFKHNREYYKQYWAKVIAAFDMPYAKGYAKMANLGQKMTNDFEVSKNQAAILTNILAPATQKMFSHETRSETYDNAIKAAVEVYLVKAKTGKLPDVLPANLPLDLFSGKPFEYEKTKDGFTLCCQEKEVGKKQPHEYQFKVTD